MQPIGYGDARRLLETMGGEEAPEAWRGGLQGLTYRFHASCYSLIEDFVCFLSKEEVRGNKNTKMIEFP